MKKQILALTLACILGIGATAHISYNLGHLKGEEDVIMNQEISGSGHTFFATYNGITDSYYQEEDTTTVLSAVQLMSDETNIIIKDMGYIIYNGEVKDLHDEEIFHCHIQEIAPCDDDIAITLIIE